MKTVFNIKIEKSLKESTQLVAKELGLPLSTIINSFMRQFVRDKEITFSTEKYRMTPYLEKLILESRKEFKEDKTSGPFKNVKEFATHLNK